MRSFGPSARAFTNRHTTSAGSTDGRLSRTPAAVDIAGK
jgi:hypothetical protein